MQGTVCLVTGATAGIGLVTARELARKGARVILVGRSSERCSQAADEIRAQVANTAVEWLVADLSSQAQVQLSSGVPFVSDADLNAALDKAGVPPDTAAVIVDHNAKSRINGLRASLGVLALIALAAVIFTRRLPVRQSGSRPDGGEGDEPDEAETPEAPEREPTGADDAAASFRSAGG